MKSISFLKGFLGLATISIAATLFFQNCSPVQFYDMEAEARLFGYDQEFVTVGMNEVPELKMVFVVDNSGTMRANQLNLSDSFGAMFDASSNSLNRFKSSTYLINTAQTLPNYTNDTARNNLHEKIAQQQKVFLTSASVSKASYESYRTALKNMGQIPGDNLGFSLKKTDIPLTYDLQPAPVLTARELTSGLMEFSSAIKSTESTPVNFVKDSFKHKLTLMSSERFPLVFDGVNHVPEHAQVVDFESGLCSIARILRNPASYINPGELVSFTVVSDENDNDPKGERCIQSIRELQGTEPLVDVECKKNQTTINYRLPTSVSTPDKCTTNGNVGYNYKFTYTKPDTVTTSVEYKYLKTAAKFSANYFKVDFKKFKSNTYEYSNTKVQFYLETCVDVKSDGIVVDKICTPKASPEAAVYKPEPMVGTCLELARSFNASALASPAPICTPGVLRTIATCDAADPLCKITPTFDSVSKTDLPGIAPATAIACETKAKELDALAIKDFICTQTNKTPANCDGQPAEATCVKTAEEVIDYKSSSPSGDKTADGCLSWAQSQTGNRVSTVADIRKCEKVTTAGAVAEYTNSINFIVDSLALDGGSTLAVGDSCGPYAEKAFNAISSKPAGLSATSPCVITGYKKSTDVTADRTLASCDLHANSRCEADKLRSCTGILTPATGPVLGNGPETLFKNVLDRVTCASKCSDSSQKICDDGVAAETTIEQFLISKFGDRTLCVAKTPIEIETDKSPVQYKVPVPVPANTCQASVIDGAPRFPKIVRAEYFLKEKTIDFVAGTKKLADGTQVPSTDLISYIKSRVAEMSSNQFNFTALVQRSSDPVLQDKSTPPKPIGSHGEEYEKLIKAFGGDISRQVASVTANDYSIALKDLSTVLKDSLERSFLMKKMRPDQIITRVTMVIKATGQEVVLDKSQWSQAGNSLKLANSVELNEGDIFQIDFQNDVKQ